MKMSALKHLCLNLILLAGISMPLTSQYSLSVEESTPAVVEGTTYRLYVNMVDPTDRMSAVFGNNEMPLSIEATAGVYNNAFNASWNASGINPMFLPFYPEMADDTYATIGLTGPAVGDEADPSLVEDSSQQISPFFIVDASTFVESNTLTGSSYYVLNTASNGLPDENMRVLIMQVTTTGDLCGSLNYQLFPLGVGADQLQLAVSFCGAGEFEAVVPPSGGGCLDALACNYDADATEDDGSCTYPEEDYLDCDGNCLEDVNENNICDVLEVFGCTISQACNFDPLATWNDGSCEYISCLALGCTDETACNFDPDAIYEDGTCEYANPPYDCNGECDDVNENDICDALEVYGCTDTSASNYNPNATIDDGTCEFDDLCSGADELILVSNYSYTPNEVSIAVGSTIAWSNIGGYHDVNGITNSITDEPFNNPEAFYLAAVNGNTNGVCMGVYTFNVPGIYNYDCSIGNHAAICMVGTIIVGTGGCTIPLACNYDPLAEWNDGSCEYISCLAFGCTDSTACNYDPSADYEDGSCEYANPPYDCNGYCEDLNENNICDVLETPGCIDETACNFDEDATLDDGSCTYAEVGYNCDGSCVNDSDGDGVCDEEEVDGCNDMNACNYEVDATENDGSCDYCSCADAGTEGYGLEVELVADHSVGELAGMSTYRVYVTTPHNDDFLSAVFGDDEDPLHVSTTTSFYQHINGSHLGSDMFPEVYTFFPELEFDSWVTIGLDQGAGAGEAAPQSIVSTDFNWVEQFEAGGNIDIDDSIGGSWFVIDPNGTVNAVSGDDMKILVMQLTTDGAPSGTINVQMFNHGSQEDVSRVALSFEGITGTQANSCGCTDPLACNFDDTANIDDGSCEFPEPGFTCDGDCVEDLDGDGICDIEDPCVGEYDECGVCNGDGIADGECDCDGNTLDALDVCGGDCEADDDGDGICDDEDECVGEYDACGICNGPGAIYDCGCADIPEGDCDCDGNQNDALGECGGDCAADADGDGICDDEDDCVGEYDECGICNGDGIADGECDCAGNVLDAIGICGGDCEADADMDGICDDEDECIGVYDECGVCNGPGAIYECGCADIPEGDCDCDGNQEDVLGECGGDCTADADADGVCDDEDDCVGEYDECGICNGDGIADGACDCDGNLPDDGYDCDGNCINDTDGDGVCDEFEIAGCTDIGACNYNELATDDDDSCEYDSCTGCTDESANNYDADATIDDGSCCYLAVTGDTTVDVLCYGDMGSAILGSEGGIGVVTYTLGGESNETGVFEVFAGLYTVVISDENNCSVEVDLEVTEPDAIEITASATDENASGELGIGTASATGGTGDINFVWTDTSGNEVDPGGLSAGIYTVTAEDDNGCTELVEVEVLLNTIVNLNPLAFGMFPNPTTGEVTIQMPEVHNDVVVKVLDGLGRIVYDKQINIMQGNTVLSLGGLTAGTYNVMLSNSQGTSVRRLSIVR